MRQRTIAWFLPLLLVVVLAVLAGLWYVHKPQNPARSFTLEDLSGQSYRMGEWRGKVVVLNFWAPWCVPCRKEMPMLVQLQEELATQGVQFVGLSVDSAENVRQFIGKHPVNYPILVGLDAILDLQGRYGETRLPYTVIVDRAGQVVAQHLGELDRAGLLQLLKPVLKR